MLLRYRSESIYAVSPSIFNQIHAIIHRSTTSWSFLLLQNLSMKIISKKSQTMVTMTFPLDEIVSTAFWAD